jgi:1,4-dihydroxy-2-naphthoyl-CoA synthase
LIYGSAYLAKMVGQEESERNILFWGVITPLKQWIWEW